MKGKIFSIVVTLILFAGLASGGPGDNNTSAQELRSRVVEGKRTTVVNPPVKVSMVYVSIGDESELIERNPNPILDEIGRERRRPIEDPSAYKTRLVPYAEDALADGPPLDNCVPPPEGDANIRVIANHLEAAGNSKQPNIRDGDPLGGTGSEDPAEPLAARVLGNFLGYASDKPVTLTAVTIMNARRTDRPNEELRPTTARIGEPPLLGKPRADLGPGPIASGSNLQREGALIGEPPLLGKHRADLGPGLIASGSNLQREGAFNNNSLKPDTSVRGTL